MKSIIYRIVLIASLVMGLSVAMSSCKDAEEQLQPDRLFRPTNISGEATFNSIELTWASVPNAVSYTIDYSTDATFATNVTTVKAEGAKVKSYVFNNLEFYTDYYFRITANSAVEGMNDSKLSVIDKAVRTKQAPTILNTITEKGDTWFTLTWTDEYPVSKIVVISEGSDDFSQEYDVTENTDRKLKIENLQPLPYVATIYSEGGIAFNSQKANLLAPILPINMADVTATSMVVRWKAGFEVSSIELLAEGSTTPIEHTITNPALGEMTIVSLQPKTRYTATIFIGENKCNSVSASTWHAVPAGAITVGASDNIVDVIASAADGAVLLLPSGASFSVLDETDAVVSLQITKNITLISASPVNYPKLIVKGIELKNTTDLNLVQFIGIEIDGSKDTAGYVMDHTSGSKAITRVEVLDCYIHDFANSLIRANRNTTVAGVSNYVADGCIIKNVKGANGFIATRVGSAGFGGNVTLSNSTITGIENQRFVYYQLGVASTQFTIKNNTFYGCTYAGNNFFDSGTSGATNDGTFIFDSNIFVNSATSKNYRIGSGSSITIKNNCLVMGWSDGDKLWANQINTINDMPTFKDAANSDFTLISKIHLDLNMGDPRWR